MIPLRGGRFVSLLVCCITLAFGTACVAIGGTAKPVLEQQTLHAVPGSFSQMWDMAAVVAKVTIVRSEVRALPAPPGAVPRIDTLHRATVIRVFKGDVQSGSSISFSQVAGQLDIGTAIVRVADEEPLAKGDYIVFLQRSPNDSLLHLIGDIDGAYRVRNGVIESQGHFTSYAKEHSGMSERRFIEEIEAVAARSPKVR